MQSKEKQLHDNYKLRKLYATSLQWGIGCPFFCTKKGIQEEYRIAIKKKKKFAK
jgi:hypothetical protein